MLKNCSAYFCLGKRTLNFLIMWKKLTKVAMYSINEITLIQDLEETNAWWAEFSFEHTDKK